MPRNFSSLYRTPITSMSAVRGIWWRATATITSPPPSFPSSDGCRRRSNAGPRRGARVRDVGALPGSALPRSGSGFESLRPLQFSPTICHSGAHRRCEPGNAETSSVPASDSGSGAEPVIGPRSARTRWRRPGMTWGEFNIPPPARRGCGCRRRRHSRGRDQNRIRRGERPRRHDAWPRALSASSGSGENPGSATTSSGCH